MCDYVYDIQNVGMRRKLALTDGFQETEYCSRIYIRNFALQDRKLHYGINRILELCVLELCECLCSIFIVIYHFSLSNCTRYSSYFIIPVRMVRSKVLMYSRITLYTSQAPTTTWYHLEKFQHCKNKGYIVI